MSPLHRLLLTAGITLVLFGLLWNAGQSGKNVYYNDRHSYIDPTVQTDAREDVSGKPQSDPMDYFK